MVKHKQRQALFDLLRKERPSETSPEVAAKPAATVRPAAAPVAAPPLAAPAAIKTPANWGPMTQVVTPRSVMAENQVTLTYGHLAFIGVGVVCLCVICFFAGWHFGRPSVALPIVDPGKSFSEVQSGPVTPGVIQPAPKNVPPAKVGRPGEGAYPGAVGPVAGGAEPVAAVPDEPPPPPAVVDTRRRRAASTASRFSSRPTTSWSTRFAIIWRSTALRPFWKGRAGSSSSSASSIRRTTRRPRRTLPRSTSSSRLLPGKPGYRRRTTLLPSN